MAKNLSVEQFKQLMKSLPPVVAAEMRKEVFKQAEALAAAQRMAAPFETGNLRASIRVEEGRHPLSAVVRAGGPLTTVETRQGIAAAFVGGFRAGVSGGATPQGSYDYSIGQEFGTSQAPAQPYFWSSYRSARKRIRAAIGRTVKPAMAKVVNVK